MTQTITEDTPYLLRIVGSEIRVEQPAELDKSFFHEEYKSILRAVGKVIESAEAYNDKKEKDKSYPDIRIHNIVPIIGLRGSGKSSVLHTVARILENNAAELPDAFAVEKDLLLGNEFFVMDSIDGSLLEPYEDIFLAILAQMNRTLPKNDDFSQEQYGGQRHLLREVRKQIEEFYGNARQMEESSAGYRREEISDLNALNRLSDSLSLRQDFQNLLNYFLEYRVNKTKLGDFCRKGSLAPQDARKHCYLVITIDDLDLNLDQGYLGLEKLHRYLMLPNVIVLLAFDHDQMKRLCEKYFYDMIPTYDSRMNAAASEVDKLARQYLEKVMPLNLRTYLPQFSLRKDVKATFDKDGEGKDYLPKHLAFKLLYVKLGMRMDTDGEKRHFLERKSLRDFINFLTLLNGLEELLVDAQPSALDKDILRHNHRILRQEITQGLAASLGSIAKSTIRDLYTSPKQLFESVVETEKPIPRAFLRLFSVILREGKWGDPKEDMLRHLANSAEYYGFSYGELLHIMYHYGRIDDDKKELIRCLIAYYALILNRSYLHLRSQQSPKQQTWEDEYAPWRKEFLELMNGSVSGSWSNSMAPQVKIYNLYYGTGLRKVFDMSKAFAINGVTFEGYFEQCALKDKERIGCFLRSVLIVGMLFDRHNYKLSETFDFLSPDDDEQTSLRGMLAQRTTDVDVSYFRPISGKGTFGFLSFVSGAFQYPEYIEKLLAYAVDYIKENKALLHLANNSKANTTIDAATEEIKREFKEWDRDYRSFAMPVYDLDVCYNLVKRLLQDSYGKPYYIESTDHLFDSYLDIYKAIAMRLHSNDEIYRNQCNVELGIDNLRPSYADAYCNCPFVRWLGIQADGSCNKGKSEVVSHTIDLTRLLLERVFMNMTTDASISASHRDAARYHRTAGYDD